MVDDGDRRLHERLVARHERALAEAYDAYAAIVYGLARRMSGRSAVAEDILQEVFLRLWLHPEDYDPARGALRAWLTVMTRRRVIDVLRREDTVRRCMDRLGADPPYATDASDTVVDDEVARLVRRAVRALPESQRNAVALAYYGGLSYREVAEYLGIPEGTAKSRLRVALRSLAARLRQDGLRE